MDYNSNLSNNNKSVAERRAPLLETISTIYSDHSSCDSSDSDEDLIKDTVQKLQIDGQPSSPTSSNHDQESAITPNDEQLFKCNLGSNQSGQLQNESFPPNNRSKVRFNVDVQVSTVNGFEQNNNHCDSYLNHSYESTPSWTIQPTTIDDGWNAADTGLTNQVHRSSSCTSLTMFGPSTNLPEQHSQLSLPIVTSNYANLPYLAQQQQHQQDIQPKKCPTQQQPGNTVQIGQQFKSILKDPLCATNRYPTVDTDRLESEIDKLLYGTGPCSSSNNSAEESTHNPETLSPMKILDMDPVLFAAAKDMNTGANEGKHKANKKLKQSNGSNMVVDNNHIHNVNPLISGNRSPCKTYIQMIEEKYRHSNLKAITTANNLSVNNAYSLSRFQTQTDDVNGQSPTSQQTNGARLSNLLNKLKPTALQNGVKNKSSKLDKMLKMKIANRSPMANNCRLKNMLQQHHSSIDQWMTTLAEESSCRTSTNDDSSLEPPKSKNNDERRTLVADQNPAKSQPQPKRLLNVRQEELYTMLSDPIKGPSINKLMDQLSKWSGSVIGSNDMLHDLKSNGQDPNGQGQFLQQFCPKFNPRKPCSLNTAATVMADCDRRFGSPFSSSSSCSGTTGRTKSLAENHIYEEILYECLQLEQKQQQQQQRKTRIDNLD